MSAKVGPRCAAVKKLARAAKDFALDQAAYAALYPDGAVSKARHIVHVVVDPAGAAAPAIRVLGTVHWPSAAVLVLALALAKRAAPRP